MSEILGVLFAVVMGTLLMTRLAHMQSQSHETSKEMVTAKQHQKVNQAASAYIQKYAMQLQSITSPTTPTLITVPMLQASAHLPAAFNATNPFGQTWQVQVLQPTTGHLQALSTTIGGTPLSDLQAARLARLVGYSGGFVPQNDSGIYPPGSAYGAFASWHIATAGFNGLTGGRPAALLTLNNGQFASNHLYRNAVPGQPQLNRMTVDLDLGSQNINNGNVINANTVSANGRVSVGEFVQIDGIATEMVHCSPNGLVGRDQVSALLSCQKGKWSRLGSQPGFAEWTYVGATGVATTDGIMVITSCFNCAISAYVNGRQRGLVSQRDKYGQGHVASTIPIMKGESWAISGAMSIGLMVFRD